MEKNIKNSVTLGSWLQIPNGFTAEIMAKAGFDWLAIDLEHGLIDLQAAFEMIQVIDLCGVMPLVRLNINDQSVIRRVMDAGARGVIVPMVNTAQDARNALDAVKYQPEGKRTYGLGRAHEYGKTFEPYIKTNNESSILIIQIEHIEAVKNLSDILSVKGIDGIIIGPYDLSGSMGIPGQFDNAEFKKSIEMIIGKVKQTDIAIGIHVVYPSEKELNEKIKQGFNFIGYGVDTIFLSSGVGNIKGVKK